MVVTSTLPKASDHDYTVHLVLVSWPTFYNQAGASDPNFGVGKTQCGAVSDNRKTGAKCRM